MTEFEPTIFPTPGGRSILPTELQGLLGEQNIEIQKLHEDSHIDLGGLRPLHL